MLKKFKKIIRKISKLIHGNIKVDSVLSYSERSSEINNFINDQKPDNKYFFYSSNDCRIYTDLNENVAVIKNGIILAGHSYQQVNGKLEKLEKNSIIDEGTPYLIKKIDGKILNLLQGSSAENYFHFMFDILPKIFLAKSIINLDNVDYFLVNKQIDWQIKIFESIGIDRRRLLDAQNNRHIKVKNIYSLTHPWYLEGYIQEQVVYLPAWIIFELRKYFLKKISPDKKLKIFIDRSNSKYNHCKIMNNAELTNFLKNQGFLIIKPEELSLNDQVDIFSNSKIIIGGHGAALTNIIFCQENTDIIEIIPSSHPSRKCERISKVLKLNYFRFLTDDTKDHKKFPYNMTVKLSELKKVINLY